jgi:hypothetical protein
LKIPCRKHHLYGTDGSILGRYKTKQNFDTKRAPSPKKKLFGNSVHKAPSGGIGFYTPGAWNVESPAWHSGKSGKQGSF